MRRRTSPPATLPPRTDTATIPGRRNYRHLAAGQRVTVAGAGTFVVRWFDAAGTSFTGYGGPNRVHRAWRTFPLDRIKTVHR